MGRQLV